MNINTEFLLTFTLIFIIFVGIPALIIGWKRQFFDPRKAQFVVLASVTIFSVFATFVPSIQRDWFTLIGGTFIIGGIGGFAGFVVFVKLAELLLLRFPSSKSQPGLTKLQKKY